MDLDIMRQVITMLNMQIGTYHDALKEMPASAGTARNRFEGIERGIIIAVEKFLEKLDPNKREFVMADSYGLRMAVDKKFGMKAESPVLRDEKLQPRKAPRTNGKDVTA